MNMNHEPGLGGEHDWHSPSYVAGWIGQDMTRDEQRRPLLRRLADLVPAGGRPVRVLDVGGGYGALSAEVLDQLPAARVVLHDYSAAMIDVARQRLARFGGRVSYTLADMTDPAWIHGLGGPFDVVVSALAIHNLGEPALIRRVYRDLFGVLRPGGDLFNFDVLFPAGPAQADLYRRDRDRDARWDVYVSPASMEAHLGWLREAGFGEVDCIWKNLEEGLLWGLRPAEAAVPRT
jgi:tRNA (cmo5U34)-methyltransferase